MAATDDCRYKTVESKQLEPINQGCFSEVFKISNTDYVLKIPKPNCGKFHDVERKIYERLPSHPGLLVFFGETKVSGDTPRNGLRFMHERTGTLREVLEDGSKQETFEQIRESGPRQLIDALVHIHFHGIVHGDIGIHNIMVGSGNELKIIDFGGSRLDDSQCLAFPSARYRRLAQPVEKRDEYEPNERDDIFALGIVIYEIGTGQILWKGMKPEDVLQRIRNKSWPELSARTDLAENMQKLVQKCWDGRFLRAKEVAEELDGGIVAKN